MRIRSCISRPVPLGIEEGYWAGSSLSFYQRFRIEYQGLSWVILTEKDRGEDWGDLVTGGLKYTGSSFTGTAGALRLHFASGLTLSYGGSWASADPLSLSKPQSWRLSIEPAESPGSADAGPLTGVAGEFHAEEFSLACAVCRSFMDPSGTGLHRSPWEIEARRSIERDLAAGRIGWGPLGVTAVYANDSEDSSGTETSRLGADLHLQRSDATCTGEFTTDLDSLNNFLISVSRGLPGLRHGVTVSRVTAVPPEASSVMGTTHRLAVGYGVRWRVLEPLVLDAGVLYMRRETGDRLRAGVLLTGRAGGRTELSQRFRYSTEDGETTLTSRSGLIWSPSPLLTLSVKTPVSVYETDDPGGEGETGYGVEVRLKHRILENLEYSLSMAGCSTDGWNSRVYAYSLSFPGEFGSTSLYGESMLLQGMAAVNLFQAAVLRCRCSWYCIEGVDGIGSGWEETPGSSRTSAGLQLDWSFQ